MRVLISTLFCILATPTLIAQFIDVSSDSLDFLPQNRVHLRVLASNDTLVAHEITITDLMTRTSPIDTSYSSISFSGDNGTWLFDYGNEDAISIDGSELFSDFSLGSSQTFELLLYEIIDIKVGDDFDKVRDVFPHAASREVTNSPHGADGIYVPYFVKLEDGKYYLSDKALFFHNDLTTDKILHISPTPD